MDKRDKISTEPISSLVNLGWWLGIAASIVMLGGFYSIDEGGSTGPDGPIEDLMRELSSHGRVLVGSMVGLVGAMLLVGPVSALRTRSKGTER